MVAHEVDSHLEDVGEVPEVEDVVELNGRRQEGGRDLLVEFQRHVDCLLRDALHLGRETSLLEMASEDAEVDGLQ